jgi:hypothetical protein
MQPSFIQTFAILRFAIDTLQSMNSLPPIILQTRNVLCDLWIESAIEIVLNFEWIVRSYFGRILSFSQRNQIASLFLADE